MSLTHGKISFGPPRWRVRVEWDIRAKRLDRLAHTYSQKRLWLMSWKYPVVSLKWHELKNRRELHGKITVVFKFPLLDLQWLKNNAILFLQYESHPAWKNHSLSREKLSVLCDLCYFIKLIKDHAVSMWYKQICKLQWNFFPFTGIKLVILVYNTQKCFLDNTSHPC